MSSIGNSIYKGAVEYQRAKSLMGAMCGTLIGICMCSVAVYLFSRKSTKIDATVLSSTCTPDSKGVTNCAIVVEYILNGKNYSAVSNSSKPYSPGGKISITYDPESPDRITLPGELSYSVISVGLMSCAVLIVLFGWSIWYFNNKYESVAAVGSFNDSLSLLNGIGRIGRM